VSETFVFILTISPQ